VNPTWASVGAAQTMPHAVKDSVNLHIGAVSPSLLFTTAESATRPVVTLSVMTGPSVIRREK
jgi:hypothetical protein